MSKVLSIRLSDVLYAQLRRQAAHRSMKPSSAARDLVRRGLGVTAHESLSIEARIQAGNQIRAAINGAMADIETEDE